MRYPVPFSVPGLQTKSPVFVALNTLMGKAENKHVSETKTSNFRERGAMQKK